MDLLVRVERIPDGGLDLNGHLETDVVETLLNGNDDSGYHAPSGSDVDLHVDRIGDSVRVHGAVTTALQSTCSRCLADTQLVITNNIDITLFPKQSQAVASDDGEDVQDERQLDTDDADESSASYDGESFDATDMIREHLLLELPMRPLCREDCAGLCDRCGQNLNEASCQCVHDDVDPRWQALTNITVS